MDLKRIGNGSETDLKMDIPDHLITLIPNPLLVGGGNSVVDHDQVSLVCVWSGDSPARQTSGGQRQTSAPHRAAVCRDAAAAASLASRIRTGSSANSTGTAAPGESRDSGTGREPD